MKQSYRKSELAEIAGVSYSSFYRFLRSRREQLSRLGCQPNCQMIRGKALEYVCREYAITLSDEPEPVPKRHVPFR